jgi:hypothetical protein
MIAQFCRTEPFRGRRPCPGLDRCHEDPVMTENTHHEAIRRNPLLAAAHEEMVKFERRENEFRSKDRAERAAELHLPLGVIKVQ